MQLQPVHQFSRIYVEKQAEHHPACHHILKKLRASNPKTAVISIEHYKDLFNRPRQNFSVQKNHPALILAVETGRLIYRGSQRINSWEQQGLHYNALVRNCVYNCDYCFLQGMHNSAHTVMFVNNEDFMEAAAERLNKEPVYMSISYLSEILAFEPLYPYSAQWIDFAAGRKNFALEIRTKSDYYHALWEIKPAENVFLVWSLSPEPLSRVHERGCASFNNRVFAASKAASDGWPLKLTFDPVLRVEGWKDKYRSMIRQTFRRIPPELVREVSFGVFRMNADYLKNIRKTRVDSPIIHHSYRRQGDLLSYNSGEIGEVRRFMEDELSVYFADESIFFVHG